MEKNCSALTAVATANCKGWSTLLNTHQIFLQLTSSTDCRLEGFATSAHISISHNLPSQALFTMQSISRSCATDNIRVCSDFFFFFDSTGCLEKPVKHFFLVSQVGADKPWHHTMCCKSRTLSFTCMPEWLWYPGGCTDILCLLQLPPDHKIRMWPTGSALSFTITCSPPACYYVQAWEPLFLLLPLFYCQKKCLMDVHRNQGVRDTLGLILGRILMLQCNL